MVTARRFMLLARVLLVPAVLIAGAALLSGAAAPQIEGCAARFAGGYAVALLAFAAFPLSRRNDLVLGLIVAAALAEVARGVLGHDFDLFRVMADAGGVLAAHIPTHIEALRKTMRETPSAPLVRRRRKGGELGWMAWLLIGGIVFATLGPQHLRPHLGDPQMERFGAFFLAAAVSVLAYPRRPITIAVLAVLVAIGLELGQLFVPGRDAAAPDAIAKALGGVCGATLAGMGLLIARGLTRGRQAAT
jgi:hypothetical protein